MTRNRGGPRNTQQNKRGYKTHIIDMDRRRMQHVLIFRKNENINCSVCDETMYNIKDYDRHTKDHYINPHYCTDCGFRTSSEEELYKHIKKCLQ